MQGAKDQMTRQRGFDGDFSHIHVTRLGQQTGSVGRIREGVVEVDPNGLVDVHSGIYDETVLVDIHVPANAVIIFVSGVFNDESAE